ncbi:MAG: HNH endonuclease [Planctomycetota bacterium]|jgi:hypothetical protein
MSKRIPLTRGKFAIVDDEDHERLKGHKWYLVKGKSTYYAATRLGNDKIISMHRMIMNLPEGREVDHINHDGLDNQKHNLRICTHKQNCRNRSPNRNSLSSYKGVTRFWGKWVAILHSEGKHHYLGRYKSEIEAAKAYDAKAQELFGEFACLNFV